MTSEERELYDQALATVVGRYGWQGEWDKEEFLQEIEAELQARLPRVRNKSREKVAEDAATFCYCRRWHRACGQNGTVTQRIAIEALYRYIYRSVFYPVGGDEAVAQEIAHQVVTAVWKNLERVREPGAFLGYVRQTARRQIPRTVSQFEPWEELTEMLEDHPEEDAAMDAVERDEERREVEELIRLCLRKRERQELIIEHILNGRSIGEIARRWGKTNGAIHTLKSRAVDQLRQCQELLDWRTQHKPRPVNDPNAPSNSVAYLLALLNQTTGPMTCDECRSWLPVYVEAEISGFDVGDQYPEVRRHLDLCAECEAEYVDLLDSTLDEMSADWSDIPVPPPDLSFLPPLSFQAYLRWLLEGVIGQLQPLRLPQLDRQMEPLLRQLAAFGARPVPMAAKVFGPDQSYERLNLATYDVARSLLQNVPSDIQSDPARLEEWVGSEARRAAEHQRLSDEDVDAFVITVTELVCGNPALLRQAA